MNNINKSKNNNIFLFNLFLCNSLLFNLYIYIKSKYDKVRDGFDFLDVVPKIGNIWFKLKR